MYILLSEALGMFIILFDIFFFFKNRSFCLMGGQSVEKFKTEDLGLNFEGVGQ